ncbi:MAG: hypothetical protein E4H20_01875, partial [Spirochaetales bacterium]
MRPNFKRTIALALSAILFLLALVACAEGPVGIFASIAGETDINKNMTKAFKDASPSFVALMDGNYYAGVGVLWKRSATGTSWNKVNTSGVASGT